MCVLLKHLCRSIILLQVFLVYFTGSPGKSDVLLAKQTTDRANHQYAFLHLLLMLISYADAVECDKLSQWSKYQRP